MVGVFIIARLGSTRLSQKHLIDVQGRTLIEWLTLRLLKNFNDEFLEKELKFFITTSIKPENRKFDSIFLNSPVEIFYGCDSNIPLRQLECAKANGIKHIISIDGDDILTSFSAARIVMEKLLENNEAVKTEGLPLGMNVMGYSTSFLEDSLKTYNSTKLETGWGRIFNAEKVLCVNLGEHDKNKKLRFTLDYEKDAQFFTNIINNFKEGVILLGDNRLIDYVVENKVFEINASLNDAYWDNFDTQKNTEIN